MKVPTSTARLAPLIRDPLLDEVARGHCLDMRRRDFVGHRSPSTGGPADRLKAAYEGAVVSRNADGTYRVEVDIASGLPSCSIVGLPDAALSMVDIDDCAAGHLLAAEHGKPGERYVLNGFTMTTREDEEY